MSGEPERIRVNVLLTCGHSQIVEASARSAFAAGARGVELRCETCGTLQEPMRSASRR